MLGGVIALIAARRVGRLRLQIWQVTLLGAAAMLATGSVSPADAVRAIDLDVILFLFGMFVVGYALEASGLLAAAVYRLTRRARSVDALLAVFLVAAGAASAVLLNDTVAEVGTPVAIRLARAHGISPRLALLALAFGLTTGSVASPIGNPQNLLIALQGGMASPFVAFLAGLTLPTALALVAVFVALRVAYRREFHGERLVHVPDRIDDRALARLGGAAVALLLALIVLRLALIAAGAPEALRLTAIALVPAALILVASPRRVEVVRRVDWPTLAFFAGLFVVVAGVARSGAVEAVVAALGTTAGAPGVVLAASTGLSQLVSNVPLVALDLPVLDHAGAPLEAQLALAAGSTIAGNIAILGAASNVIIVDIAERRFGITIGFWEFLRVGLPLTLAQLAVFALFLGT